MYLVKFISSSQVSPAMRVLFVTNMWPEASQPWYGTFIKSQADSLERLGVGVDVLYIRGYLDRTAYFEAVPSVSRVLARQTNPGYSLVHAHYGHSGLIGRLQLNRPLIVSYCGDDLLGTPRVDGRLSIKSRMERIVFRWLASVADATITKSTQMEAHLPRARQRRNYIIPNGVDVDRFDRVTRAKARQVLGWDESSTNVLFVGNRQIARKNFTLAERVVRAACSERPGLALRVVWRVDPSDIPYWMKGADALLVTSSLEGSPNMVKEAMAAQLPVVSTPVGDVAERLTGVSGCFICQPQVETLSRALIAAVDHGPTLEARRAIEGLSLPAIASRVVSVYREVTSD